MKTVYPVIFEKDDTDKIPYYVYVPDFDASTQGTDLADAIDMAADLISLICVQKEDEGKEIPVPSEFEDVLIKKGQIKTLVSVDFEAYRKKIETKAVKKTLSVPSWLNVQAEKAGINFSAVLQNALKRELHIIE